MKTKADLAVRSGGEPDEVSTLTPEDELIRLERQALLEVAVAQLDDRCRTLIESLFYSPKDKSYRQIANELGIPPNSLGPIRSRCLKRLKKILDEMG